MPESKIVRVSVQFDSGSMNRPPRSRHMTPVCIGDGLWTLVLLFDQELSENLWETEATAQFLVPEAPSELLTSGKTLELLGGSQVVGTACVLEEE